MCITTPPGVLVLWFLILIRVEKAGGLLACSYGKGFFSFVYAFKSV